MIFNISYFAYLLKILHIFYFYRPPNAKLALKIYCSAVSKHTLIKFDFQLANFSNGLQVHIFYSAESVALLAA
jgi:hypothetical protein